MSVDILLLAAPAIPAIGAILIAFAGRRPNLRETVTLVTAAALLADVLALLPSVLSGARPSATLLEVLPGLTLRLELEPLGMLFALVASSLWILNSVYSIGYMRANGEHHQTRFYVCFAVALASTMGIALAGNLLTLFIFYETLTLSTYPLVTHKGDAKARAGGRTYLGILLSTSIAFFLVAIIWTWSITGTLDFQSGGILDGKLDGAAIGILLALYMFGIGKAALMPFHRWLPAAMVAPTPVSALLHAVAVVKAGVFTVLKVIVYIFGIDFLSASNANDWLTIVAAVTLLGASFIALSQDNLKARLAYSTVSQLSYIVLGAALAHSAGIIGGGMHLAMHAFGKITLFFCAGAIYTAAHKTDVSQLDGIGHAMPVTMFAFFLGSLSIIGLPPFGGSWSKWFLALGAFESGHVILVGVLMLSSLLNIAYLMPIVARAFFVPDPRPIRERSIAEAPLACVVPLCLTAIGGVALFVFADSLHDLLAPIVAR